MAVTHNFKDQSALEGQIGQVNIAPITFTLPGPILVPNVDWVDLGLTKLTLM